MPDTNPTRLFGQVAIDLFGSDWVAPMTRLTAVNKRTIQRLWTAVKEGREDPAASGVLAAVREALLSGLALIEKKPL